MKKTQFRATITMPNPFKKDGFAYWDGAIYEENGKGFVKMYGQWQPLSNYYRRPNWAGYVLVYLG